MKTTIYMGISLDGFVARADDRLDFLPPVPEGEEAGDASFSAFLDTVDVLLMGRRTFEVVRSFGPEGWAYGDTPVVVLSRTLSGEDLPPTVSVRAGDPAEILEALAAEGHGHVYVDGASVAQRFLAEGLVDELVITHVPVLIGEGIRLWGPLPHDVRLRLLASRVLPGEMVQSHYAVAR